MNKIIFKNKKVIASILVFILLSVLVIIDKANIITDWGLSPTLWTSIIAMTIPLTVTILLWDKEKKARISEIETNNRLQKQLTVRAKYVDYFEEMIQQLREFEIFLNVYLKNKKNPFAFNISESEKLKHKLNSSYSAIRGIGVHTESKEVWKFNFNEIAFKSIGIDIFNYKYKDEIISLREYRTLLQLVNILGSIRQGYKYELRGLGMYSVEINEEDSKEIILELFEDEENIVKVENLVVYLKDDIEIRLSI